MINSQYQPNNWAEMNPNKVQTHAFGIYDTVSANSTKTIDTLIADDSFVRAIEFMANGSTFGDTVTMKIVDVDGVYAPAGTVLGTPVDGWVIISDQDRKAAYEAIVPMLLKGGLYIRMIYVNTGLLGSVKIAFNLALLKVVA
jgi:hypothetical protein